MQREARADVTPMRQRTQFSCMATSMTMALQACGHDCTEDQVNKVMGCRPGRGARWEEILACAQHYGCRAHLTVPATLTQVKTWTDAGKPVIIAWNPEGRPWSHASLIFDVTDGPEGRMVHVADPNIPNPEKTVRVVPEDEFYGKWYEKWPEYLVRRPACVIEREIDDRGRQLVASHTPFKTASADMSDDEKNTTTSGKSEKMKGKAPKTRNPVVREMIQRGWGSGTHKNKGQRGQGQKGKGKGQRHPKHKKDYRRMAQNVAATYLFSSRGRLDPKLRRKINADLIKSGLDGNGRFRKPERGYSLALDVLSRHGLELDTVVNTHSFQQRPSGTLSVDVAFTNEEDPFSPKPIDNSTLYLQYTELREGVFEVVAYMS